MDDPNITMEEYIRLEEEKARKHRKVFNWETAKYGKDNDDDKVDIEHSSRDLSVKALSDVINTDVGAYAQSTVYTMYSLNEYGIYMYQYGGSWGPRERNIDEYWWRIYKYEDLEVLES
nr:hypothetical protein [Tanacetum cinerariifolium]